MKLIPIALAIGCVVPPALAQSTYQVNKVISSSDPAHAFPVTGTVNEQLSQFNVIGPPEFGSGWLSVTREDLNQGCAYICGDPQTCIISANEFLLGADEVTYDGCTSVWIRFTFVLEPDFEAPLIDCSVIPGLNGRGVAADDQARLWFNKKSITDEIVFGCTGSGDCTSLSWPTRDGFIIADPSLFRPGINELVFGVFADDGNNIEPTGIEFRADLSYERPLYTNYCSSGPNSSGQAAKITASGSPSVAENSLILRAEPVPNTFGLFVSATGMANVPFGNGRLCVSGQIKRLIPAKAINNKATRVADLAMLGIQAGDRRHFQYWFRDKPAGGANFDTSNGLYIDFLP